VGLREDLLPVIDEIRQLIGDPDQLGLRQSRVWVRRRAYSAGEQHLGDITDTDVEITPRPKVEEDTPVTLKVSRITPTYAGGGYTTEDLMPAQVAGVKRYFLVQTGTDGPLVPYQCIALNEYKNFGISLMLERLVHEQPEEYVHDDD
jgi:hypothetical protein